MVLLENKRELYGSNQLHVHKVPGFTICRKEWETATVMHKRLNVVEVETTIIRIVILTIEVHQKLLKYNWVSFVSNMILTWVGDGKEWVGDTSHPITAQFLHKRGKEVWAAPHAVVPPPECSVNQDFSVGTCQYSQWVEGSLDISLGDQVKLCCSRINAVYQSLSGYAFSVRNPLSQYHLPSGQDGVPSPKLKHSPIPTDL